MEELGRLFDQLNHSLEETRLALERRDPVDALGAPFTSWRGGYGWMSVDVVDHEDELVVTADLPGFETDEVSVRVEDTRLIIEAEHEDLETESEEDTTRTYLRRERTHRELSRSLPLPTAIDTEHIEAKMKKGVLTVRLPKAAVEEATTIEISED
jgi:HSP20 family protein